MERWILHLGRVDTMFALSSLDRFSNAPRKGHFEKLKRIFEFLKNYPNREVCIDPKISLA